VPTVESEDAFVQAPAGRQKLTTVQAVTDKGVVHWGRSLSVAQKQRARDCIVAAISR
jgi:hypothetical protein